MVQGTGFRVLGFEFWLLRICQGSRWRGTPAGHSPRWSPAGTGRAGANFEAQAFSVLVVESKVSVGKS